MRWDTSYRHERPTSRNAPFLPFIHRQLPTWPTVKVAPFSPSYSLATWDLGNSLKVSRLSQPELCHRPHRFPLGNNFQVRPVSMHGGCRTGKRVQNEKEWRRHGDAWLVASHVRPYSCIPNTNSPLRNAAVQRGSWQGGAVQISTTGGSAPIFCCPSSAIHARHWITRKKQ